MEKSFFVCFCWGFWLSTQDLNMDQEIDGHEFFELEHHSCLALSKEEPSHSYLCIGRWNVLRYVSSLH